MPVVRRSNDYGIEVAAFQKFSKIAKFFRCLALNGSYVFGSLVEDGRIDVAEADAFDARHSECIFEITETHAPAADESY